MSLALTSLCVVETAVQAVLVAPKSTLRLEQLVLLVQEVQAVVAGQPTDGELVGDFGPLLAIRRHPLVQLSGPGEEFRQEPARREMEEELI